MLMSRSLLTTLEAHANELFEHSVGELRTEVRELPEEVRWLGQYGQVRWRGPAEVFWQRYAVLSDAQGLARRWVDDEAQDYLLLGDAEAAAKVPLLVMLMRGRAYLRLQVNPHAEGADALLALDMLEHLAGRALELAGPAGEEDVSNRG